MSRTLFFEQFTDAMLSFRKHWTLQGDNGAFMEALLILLGREKKENGLQGYNASCEQLLFLPMPSRVVMGSQYYLDKNWNYSVCFFDQLELLAGPENNRRSKSIGFHRNNDESIPWLNCWSMVRESPEWSPWIPRCFAIHFNGGNHPPAVVPPWPCKAPTFNWANSPYNPWYRQ